MAQCMWFNTTRICLVGTQWHDSMHIYSLYGGVCTPSDLLLTVFGKQAPICKGTEAAATRRSVSASIASMYLAAKVAAANMFTVGCCHPILP
jgi:hypothetical protein